MISSESTLDAETKFIFKTVCNNGFLLNVVQRLITNPSKLATLVENDQKAPFSIATTPRCRGARYSFPWIAPLHPRYVPYNAEC